MINNLTTKIITDDFCCERTCRGDTKQVMKSLSVKDGEGQTAESGQGEALRGAGLMKSIKIMR